MTARQGGTGFIEMETADGYTACLAEEVPVALTYNGTTQAVGGALTATIAGLTNGPPIQVTLQARNNSTTGPTSAGSSPPPMWPSSTFRPWSMTDSRQTSR